MMRIEFDISQVIEFFNKLLDKESEINVKIRRAMIEALKRTVYDKIVSDPEVPEEYKKALAIAEDPDTNTVYIGPVYDYAVLLERGTRAGWCLYRCPKHYYLGGTMKRRIVPGRYLERTWSEASNDFIAECTKEIADIIRGEIG